MINSNVPTDGIAPSWYDDETGFLYIETTASIINTQGLHNSVTVGWTRDFTNIKSNEETKLHEINCQYSNRTRILICGTELMENSLYSDHVDNVDTYIRLKPDSVIYRISFKSIWTILAIYNLSASLIGLTLIIMLNWKHRKNIKSLYFNCKCCCKRKLTDVAIIELNSGDIERIEELDETEDQPIDVSLIQASNGFHQEYGKEEEVFESKDNRENPIDTSNSPNNDENPKISNFEKVFNIINIPYSVISFILFFLFIYTATSLEMPKNFICKNGWIKGNIACKEDFKIDDYQVKNNLYAVYNTTKARLLVINDLMYEVENSCQWGSDKADRKCKTKETDSLVITNFVEKSTKIMPDSGYCFLNYKTCKRLKLSNVLILEGLIITGNTLYGGLESEIGLEYTAMISDILSSYPYGLFYHKDLLIPLDAYRQTLNPDLILASEEDPLYTFLGSPKANEDKIMTEVMNKKKLTWSSFTSSVSDHVKTEKIRGISGDLTCRVNIDLLWEGCASSVNKISGNYTWIDSILTIYPDNPFTMNGYTFAGQTPQVSILLPLSYDDNCRFKFDNRPNQPSENCKSLSLKGIDPQFINDYTKGEVKLDNLSVVAIVASSLLIFIFFLLFCFWFKRCRCCSPGYNEINP